MRIAIASDFHIGFGKGTEREQEAFEQAKQAFELALKEKADLLLLAGDLFDSDVPSQEAWLEMFKLFSVLRGQKQSEICKVKKIKNEKVENFLFSTIPVIAIAGTHEFRSKDFKNALDVLQEAGCLVYLHAAKAELELSGEKVVVQGLSGVPEKKALDALKMWGPKPVQGATNIVLLHQSIKEFLPFDDEMIASIALADLPSGFDLIVDGHLHWSSQENLEKKRFIVPGSTVITQMKKLESTKPKGIFLFESKENKLQFIPLPEQRQFLFEKLEFREARAEQIREAIGKRLSGLLSNAKGKPLVKLKLKGSLAKGLTQADLDLREIRENFRENCIIAIDADFEQASFKQKLQELREAQLGKKSIAAMGFDLLEKNLQETQFKNAFDVKRIFDLLANNEIDKAVEVLSESKKG
ncbi:MAG: metallophosphoesterase [Candidatus Diapherotrites archaeon]|uniref:Metallophosphoesterase n=1 Tax=Candidatus Iainarchaeum sp. TaxID=3101447 RepID=A0A938YTP1_9ARCH|nr:metallophosphoesterase [Candidatus Diapherotrites archaeon]